MIAVRLLSLLRPPVERAAGPGAGSPVPAGAAAGFVVLHFAWWSTLLVLGHRALELDSAEQLVWSYSLEAGYWKHPPLPSWLMHGLVQCVGPSQALPIVATQAAVALALWCTWRACLSWMPPGAALAGTALTAVVTYHGLGADAFNHTVLLLPLQAAMVWSGWCAMTRRSLAAWWITGVMAGLAMLVKYVALLPMAALALALALDPRSRERRNIIGATLATAMAACIFAPHWVWMLSSDFLPLRYARSVSEAAHGSAALRSTADFVLMQALRLSPLLLLLGWFANHGKASGSRAAHRPLAAARRYMLVNALLPLALTLAWGLASRTALPSRWGGNEFLLAGPLAVAWLRGLDFDAAWRRVVAAVLVAEAVIGLGATLPRAALAERLGIASRAGFPADELTRQALRVWHEQVPDQPLRLVVSDVWLAGNLVAGAGRPLAVLIDGEASRAPWVPDDAVARCGALVLQDGDPVPDAVQAHAARADVRGEWALPWSAPPWRPGRAEPRNRIRWAIERPRPGAPACLL